MGKQGRGRLSGVGDRVDVHRAVGSTDRPEVVPVACVVAIVVAAAAINPAGLHQYQLPKLAVAGVAVPVGLASLVWLRQWPRHRVLWGVAAFVVVTLAATLASPAPRTALLGMPDRGAGLLTLVVLAGAFVLALSAGRTGADRIVSALLATSLPISGYGILQRLGVDPWPPDAVVRTARASSTFGSATFLGGYLALVVPIAVGVALCGGWRSTRSRLAGVSAAAGVACLVLTQSRGAWLGGALGAGLVIGHWLVRGERDRARVGLVAVLVVLGSALLLAPATRARVGTLARPAEGTAGGRLALWKMGVAAIGERPVLGWGPDVTRVALFSEVPSGFEATYGDGEALDRVHNTVLDIAVWTGVLGLGVVGATIVSFAIALTRGAPSTRRTCFTLGAGLIGYGVHLIFNFPQPELDLQAVVVAGVALGAAGVAIGGPVRARIVAVPALVACALALGVVQLRMIAADVWVNRAATAEARGDLARAGAGFVRAAPALDRGLGWEVLARFSLRHQRYAEAWSAANKALAAHPGDPYLEELAGSVAAAAANAGNRGLGPVALQLLDPLVQRAPFDASARTSRGLALAAVGRNDDAKADWRRAIEIAPRRPEAYVDLGLLAEAEGVGTTAADWFRRALAIDPGNAAASRGLQRNGAS